MGELPEMLETLVLGPNDRLVVVVPNHTTPEDMARFKEQLERVGLVDRTVAIAGIEQLAVLRGDAE